MTDYSDLTVRASAAAMAVIDEELGYQPNSGPLGDALAKTLDEVIGSALDDYASTPAGSIRSWLEEVRK